MKMKEDVKISCFKIDEQKEVFNFLEATLISSNRYSENKIHDIHSIQESYVENGNFWCAKSYDDKIIGTIGVRKIDDFYEIRRFFVKEDFQNMGVGNKLLKCVLDYLISKECYVVKIAVMNQESNVHHLISKYNFEATEKYNNSSADLFYQLKLSFDYIYTYKLKNIKESFDSTLILNPTENIPMYSEDTNLFEGLYISERFKDASDKVIFAGRNDYISFFEDINKKWKEILGAHDVDLKTLSGLNAHLILFLCAAKKGDTILLLPEEAGGHFSTGEILNSLGMNVVHMQVDMNNLCVDVDKTKEIIKAHNPKFLFVDRSEGLYFEDFSWVKELSNIYKIFDASQYFADIIVKEFDNPFDFGFDMIVTTLHKNYPGPQKGLLAVKSENDPVWERYQRKAKVYISNTHPKNIANSIQPFLDFEKLKSYSLTTKELTDIFEKEMLKREIPIIQKDKTLVPTLHVWLKLRCKEDTYAFYLKLEELGLLTNYRQLPYELGHGLRIGFSAAVRSGLTKDHMDDLCDIFERAYKEDLTLELKNKARTLINIIKNC